MMSIDQLADEIAEPLDTFDLDVFAAQVWNQHEFLGAAERLQKAGLISPNASGTRKDGWLQRYRTALGDQLGYVNKGRLVLSQLGKAVRDRLNNRPWPPRFEDSKAP